MLQYSGKIILRNKHVRHCQPCSFRPWHLQIGPRAYLEILDPYSTYLLKLKLVTYVNLGLVNRR